MASSASTAASVSVRVLLVRSALVRTGLLDHKVDPGGRPLHLVKSCHGVAGEKQLDFSHQAAPSTALAGASVPPSLPASAQTDGRRLALLAGLRAEHDACGIGFVA